MVNKVLLKFKQHMFFCTHTNDSKPCCSKRQSETMFNYAKNRIKEMGLHKINAIRVNQSSCLGFCESGPVLVIYPDGVWYRYANEQDVDEIIEQHILGGELVQRLLLK